ncbi:hypothetical protein N0V84_007412 [Fusarium piperis]|uniref:Hsp70 protein n=1 Tax=Fusarium piperis TaxID=1435070 RepID=A0A9W8WA39_9HYPO|nr:hypothetical protein N0V84_007412 [Fusarium piperis]
MPTVDNFSIRQRARLIVGIDYGTTYSGVSFAMSTATDFKEIKPWTAYPGSASHRSEHCEKAPSLVSFADENEEESGRDLWGYQVEPGMKAYAWTKLHLDRSARASEYDDPGLKKAIGNGMMKLPRGRTAKEIVTTYLRGLNTMYQGVAAEKFGEGYLDNLPVDFWLTVPATWSDAAKQLTLEAAQDAGFASRTHDRVRLITEPEAAAHLALKSSIHHVQDLIEVGARVMVCDLGGGTVDITSYEVQSTSPSLRLRELCVGGGGKCGGTFVDRNFHALMEKRFGKAFTSLDPEMTGPGSHFMDQFEMAKRDFSLNLPKTRPHRLHLPMASLPVTPESKKHYDGRFGYVLITQEDMESFFDPVWEKIMGLVTDQVNRVKEETSKGIDHLVLVGGFGSSPYIKERLKEYCLARNIRITTPWSGAWSAVVCGAVLRGIEGAITTERRCRRHYGYECSEIYDARKYPDYDPNKRPLFKTYYSERWMLGGFMHWLVAKNDVLQADWNVSRGFNMEHAYPDKLGGSIHLYACNLDKGPDTIDSDDVEHIGKINYVLNTLDLSTTQQKRMDGGRITYRVPLTFNLRVTDEDALFELKVLHQGKECGQGKIAFSYSFE